MPNGEAKNWIRLLAAVDGFRDRYGAWPTRVRLFPVALRGFREDLFTPEALALVVQRLELVEDDAPMVAEDDEGNSYSYGAEGFPKKRPNPNADQWLSVRPDRGPFDD